MLVIDSSSCNDGTRQSSNPPVWRALQVAAAWEPMTVPASGARSHTRPLTRSSTVNGVATKRGTGTSIVSSSRTHRTGFASMSVLAVPEYPYFCPTVWTWFGSDTDTELVHRYAPYWSAAISSNTAGSCAGATSVKS